MPEAPTPTTPAKPRFLRRWLRRFAWSFLVLVVLLAMFYRPLIRWAAAHFGQQAARDAGMEASWNLEGNFFSGMDLRDVKVDGNAASQVRSVTLDHVNVTYDLTEFKKQGVGAILKEITVSNLTADIDLTKPGEPGKPPKPKDDKPSAPLPALQFPKVNISHVNLHMKTEGGLVEIEDFSLTLDPDAPGTISWAKVAVPGIPPMGPMQGVTKLTPQTLQFENLALRPDTILQQLSLDIAKLAQEEVAVKVAMRQGGAKLAVDGTVGNWSKDLTADADVKLENLNPADLASWGVPVGDIAWGVKSLAVSAHGPVLLPQSLKCTVQAEAEPFTVATGSGVLPAADAGPATSQTDSNPHSSAAGSTPLPVLQINATKLDAKIEGGKLLLNQLSTGVGANEFVATGEAKLPATWADAAQADGKISFKLDAKNIAQLTPQVEGAATADGSVEFGGQQLRGANVNLNAKSLTAAGIPIETVTVKATSSKEMATLERADVVLNAQNTVSATGTFGLAGDHALTAQWKADCADLASLPTQVRAGTIWPAAGVVKSQGSAKGTLAAIQKQDWPALTANVTVDASGVKLNDATLQSLNVKASLAQGQAKLEQLALQLDPENSVQAQGNCALGNPEFPLAADVHIVLPNVAALSAWGEPFGAPKLEAGSVQVNWKAAGKVKPLVMDGNGTAEIAGLKLSTMPEILGLKATIEQQGETAKIPTLEATAGPWRAAGSVAWDGKRLDVASLEGWLKEVSLVKLSASLPLNYKEESLQLKLAVDQLDSSKVAASLGQTFPAKGLVSLNGEFSGTLKELSGGLKLDVTNIVIAQKEAEKLKPGSVGLQLNLAEGKLTAEGVVDQKPLEPLKLQAALPVDIPALMETPGMVKELPLDAKVSLPQSALNFLPSFVPMVQRINGTLALDVEATGTVTAPKLEGTVHLAVPDAVFADTSLPSIKNLKINLLADQEHVHIQDAEMLVSGGPLKLSGNVGLVNLKDPAFDLKLLAEEILLKRDDMISLRANADISCVGKLSGSTVQGKVDLVRGRVFKEIEIVPLSLPNQLPPPPASTKLGKEGLPELPAFLHDWKFDVAVKTKDPIRLMSTVAHGSVLVDVALAGTGAKPDVSGKVNLKDTWVKLPFSRLNIVSCDVTIRKENPLDPQLELIGESVVANYMVTLNASGRAMDPKLRFSSSPPLSEGDITYLLATGTTADDLGAGNGEAAGRAMFLVFQSAYRKLFPKLAAAAEDKEPPKLSFELSGFGNDPSRRGVAAIYELTPKMKAIGRVGENGTFRGLLYYQIRFK